ncbi:MAG TPA: VCBS repeat-containing protein [Rhodothermales bacterium]|nr:VCBS repeat-containing protein [Rhodothermales bacterium]
MASLRQQLSYSRNTILKLTLLTAVLLTGHARLSGQEVILERIDQAVASLNGPAVAFGDFDDDGDMDILVSGNTAVEFPFPITRVYIGTGESMRVPPGGGLPRWFRDFEERGLGISAVWIGAVAWLDANRDGRLGEFIISGARNAEPPYTTQAATYRAEGGGFSRTSDDFVGLLGGSVDVGDYNNDGKDDLLLTGSDGVSYRSILYDGSGNGQFTPSSISLPGVGLGTGRFGDYDGDGDLDIFLIGESDAGPVAHLLRNDGGQAFSEVSNPILPVVFASADWGDYDADGDLDLLVAGARLSPVLAEGQTTVYRNDGDGIFTAIQATIEGTYHGFSRWGDMDNDGLLDIVQAGGSGVTRFDRSGQIYVNRGSDQFEFAFNISGLRISAGDLGDYDGDGDLDLVQLGQGVVVLYRNEHYLLENPPPLPLGRPDPPSGLLSAVDGNAVTLSWLPGSDEQTPQEGLSYNIRVGTVPGSVDIVAPLAHPSNGKRKVSRLGNVQINRAWTIRGLGPGTYYWSVQTLDASFSGSDFAGDQTFVIQ